MNNPEPRRTVRPSESLPSYQQIVSSDRTHESESEGLGQPIRVVVGGNANFSFLLPALRVGLRSEGLIPEVRTAAFGNWVAETFSNRDQPPEDVWIIWLSSMGATRGGTERPDHDLKAMVAATERLLARGIKVIIIPPEPLLAEDDPFSPFAIWRHQFNDTLRTSLSSGVIQLPVNHVQRRIGMSEWVATRYWEQAKAPCHPNAATAVGLEVAAVIARTLRPRVRAVAVDLDDTLWGGLVGEVGPEGLDLEPDGIGRPYLELQRLLHDLTHRGIPIAVVSKNDPEVARRPFRERSEMLLSLDSFVRFDASWQPKYLALQALAHQLNIGIESICFLDDSPKERDEARAMLPGLIIPDLDRSPALRVAQLIHERWFLTPVVREEDRLRVEYFKRASLPIDADLDTYLSQLGMRLEVLPVDSTIFDRTLSLLHKTNQFNLSLWRPSPSDLQACVDDANHYVHAFRLTDRVSEAGIISVLIAEVQGTTVVLKGWVLSCRVFDRGVEWAAIEHLNRWIQDRGITAIIAPFVAGPRNDMLRSVLARIGFQPGPSRDATTEYHASTLTVPRHHITFIDL